MENDFLYSIGEILMLELEDIESVTYPQKQMNTLKIETKSGKCYQLILKAIE